MKENTDAEPSDKEINEDVEERKQPKPRQRSRRSQSQAKNNPFDEGVSKLSKTFLKLASVAVGLTLLILGGNALLALVHIVPSESLISPTGEPYTKFFVTEPITTALIVSISIIIFAIIYKIVPIIKTQSFLTGTILFIIKIVIALAAAYYTYYFVLKILTNIGWIYPNILPLF